MALLAASCNRSGEERFSNREQDVERFEDTLKTYFCAGEVETALRAIDSNESNGVISSFDAALYRAKAYTQDDTSRGKAFQICTDLLNQNSLTPYQRCSVLGHLVYLSKLRQDDEQTLKYGTLHTQLCRELGDITSALVSQSAIGLSLINLGRIDEGLEKINNAINELSNVRRFTEMDACILAMKNKIRVLDGLKRQDAIIPVGDSILAKLHDLEENPDIYNDGSRRMPNEGMLPGYIDFYSGQAYAFLSYAYAKIGDMKEARKYCTLFENTNYGNTFDGKKLISSTWCLLGDFQRMNEFYDELEKIWSNDTIQYDYAVMLRNRAEAARQEGNLSQCVKYLQRHAALLELLGDAERQTAAQEQAARYHEQEQQMALEMERAISQRMTHIVIILALIVVLVVMLLVMLFRQMTLIKQKNKVLSKEIKERIEYQEKYLFAMSNSDKFNCEKTDEMIKDNVMPTQDKTATLAYNKAMKANMSAMNDKELFDYLSRTIIADKLYLDSLFDRQQLMERFHLSKDRIGAAFARGSKYSSLTSFVNEIRLQHSAKLLAEHPEMTVNEVALASGFASNSLFARNFKQKYALTPTEFRKKNEN